MWSTEISLAFNRVCAFPMASALSLSTSATYALTSILNEECKETVNIPEPAKNLSTNWLLHTNTGEVVTATALTAPYHG
jgi:hypothetical protein